MIPPLGSESVVNCTDLFSDDKPYISEIDPIHCVVLPFFNVLLDSNSYFGGRHHERNQKAPHFNTKSIF